MMVQAVGRHETGYGRGWARSCPAMAQSHNWGAIQGSPGAMCRDTHEDGSAYHASYRIYPTDEAGAADLWRELARRPYVRRVLSDDSLDVSGLARAMRASGYYEATERSYAAALARSLDAILRAGVR